MVTVGAAHVVLSAGLLLELDQEDQLSCAAAPVAATATAAVVVNFIFKFILSVFQKSVRGFESVSLRQLMKG